MNRTIFCHWDGLHSIRLQLPWHFQVFFLWILITTISNEEISGDPHFHLRARWQFPGGQMHPFMCALYSVICNLYLSILKWKHALGEIIPSGPNAFFCELCRVQEALCVVPQQLKYNNTTRLRQFFCTSFDIWSNVNRISRELFYHCKFIFMRLFI